MALVDTLSKLKYFTNAQSVLAGFQLTTLKSKINLKCVGMSHATLQYPLIADSTAG